jgi:hypothetical protein
MRKITIILICLTLIVFGLVSYSKSRQEMIHPGKTKVNGQQVVKNTADPNHIKSWSNQNAGLR